MPKYPQYSVFFYTFSNWVHLLLRSNVRIHFAHLWMHDSIISQAIILRRWFRWWANSGSGQCRSLLHHKASIKYCAECRPKTIFLQNYLRQIAFLWYKYERKQSTLNLLRQKGVFNANIKDDFFKNINCGNYFGGKYFSLFLIKDWRASNFQNRSSEVAQPFLKQT